MSWSRPTVSGFHDPATSTVSYVVADPATRACAVIDPVLDLDLPAGRLSTENADRITRFVTSHKLSVEWLIETHVHADHLSAAPLLQARLGGRIGISAHIIVVQTVFARIFNVEAGFRRDGSQFDRLFADGDTYQVGRLTVRVMHTPGHTPACTTHVVGDAAFVGDTLFLPDVGTARADFPGGDARALYRSIRKVLALPPDTRVFVCHDYPPDGRDPAWETTIAAERAGNLHVRDGIDEERFVAVRTARDATLGIPRLIAPAIQVNMRAGTLPPPEANGCRYLKLPLQAPPELR